MGVGLGSLFPCWLLARVHPELLEAFLLPLNMDPSIIQRRRSLHVLLTLQFSFLLQGLCKWLLQQSGQIASKWFQSSKREFSKDRRWQLFILLKPESVNCRQFCPVVLAKAVVEPAPIQGEGTETSHLREGVRGSVATCHPAWVFHLFMFPV